MMIRTTLALCMGLLAVPVRTPAQSPLSFAARLADRCTFDRTCNWTSHAAIAFGLTCALDRLNVPRGIAGGAAALLYVGKELRDHMRWGVLGSADSNGDMISGAAGALIAYHLARKPLHLSFAGLVFIPGEPTSIGVRLRLF